MKELVEFLRARLKDDKQVARKNTGDHGLGPGGFPDYRTYDGPDIDAADEFIFHFKPARMLAEVEAKRRIVDLHGLDHECSTYDHHGEIDNCSWVTGCCSTLQLLAVPYADHPDYNPAWAPANVTGG